MYRLGSWLSGLTNVTTLLGGCAIVLMMLHITADVILRYLFSAPLPGTITYVANYYMIIATFVPLAYAEKLNAHITVEVFTERLPLRVQYHLAHWLLPLSAAVLLLMTIKTWAEAMIKFEINASLVEGGTTIITWPGYFMLPLGLGMMVLVMVYKFVIYLTGARSGLVASDEEQAIAWDVHPDMQEQRGGSHE